MLGTYEFYTSEESQENIVKYLKKELRISEKKPRWESEFDEYRKLVLRQNNFQNS